MKKGDLVRYRPLVFQEMQPDWEIGLLVEYHTWEKLATVMKDGKFFRVPADMVQKAGKKDGLR